MKYRREYCPKPTDAEVASGISYFSAYPDLTPLNHQALMSLKKDPRVKAAWYYDMHLNFCLVSDPGTVHTVEDIRTPVDTLVSEVEHTSSKVTISRGRPPTRAHGGHYGGEFDHGNGRGDVHDGVYVGASRAHQGGSGHGGRGGGGYRGYRGGHGRGGGYRGHGRPDNRGRGGAARQSVSPVRGRGACPERGEKMKSDQSKLPNDADRAKTIFSCSQDNSTDN